MNITNKFQGSFPCKANWVVFQKHDGRIFARNCLLDENIELSLRQARYLQSLDGYTNPYDVDGYTLAECYDYYRQFHNEMLLRKGNKVNFGDVSFMTLFIPEHMRTNSLVPKIYNCLLMLLCLPVFIIGVYGFISTDISYISNNFITLGFILGVIIGIVTHELSHAMACLAYGGRLLEAGVSLHMFLPSAYCMIDDNTIGKRNKKLKLIQIKLAGVEMNLFLSGLSLTLISLSAHILFLSSFTGMFLGFAIQNLFFTLINLTFVEGLDGEQVIGLLLGYETMMLQAEINIETMQYPQLRRKFFREFGVNGVASIFISIVLMLFKAVVPMLILAEIIYVIGGVFSWISNMIF